MTIRYVSQIFQPVLTIPKNAVIKNSEITCKSQKLLLECGLIRPTSSGLFALLPLARRALDKLEGLVHNMMEDIGAQRISLPDLTATSLWKKSGRLDAGGPELMTMMDRHGKKYLLAPTHEEAIADLLADTGPLSYKQLPLILYQITNKYRDEARPKHGLLRARSFLMCDAYSAHSDAECARATYQRVACKYKQLFDTLKLNVHTVEAPTGDIGGSLSHEWQLPAESGEDAIQVCPSCSHSALGDKEGVCEKCGKDTQVRNSIEVGHTFLLGTKYSHPLNAHVTPPTGPPTPLYMACYGIGITRLLAASLEALSTDTTLRWPEAIAPFSAIVIGPKEGSKEWSSDAWDRVHMVAERLGGDVLIDDRHHLTIGKRALMADKMGYPTVVICGRSSVDPTPRYEVYHAMKCIKPSLHTIDELDSIALKSSGDLNEVGHTFLLGTKYSHPLNAHVTPPTGPPTPLYMACYGIGITRLLAASLEALSTDTTLRWPEAIAPFSAIVIGPKEGSKEWSNDAWDRVHMVAERLGGDVLIDDRHHLTIGKRALMADKMGYPTVVICGRSSVDPTPRYEVYRAMKCIKPSLHTIDELDSIALKSSGDLNEVKN